jgi:hypothetical protein
MKLNSVKVPLLLRGAPEGGGVVSDSLIIKIETTPAFRATPEQEGNLLRVLFNQ